MHQPTHHAAAGLNVLTLLIQILESLKQVLSKASVPICLRLMQAAVDGAIEVPIYIPETRWSPINVLKQLSNFGLGGWWLGGSHMIPNQTFMQDVRGRVPQDAKVIVACQKGLR